MSSRMPIPHLHVSDYIESNGTPFSPDDSRIPEHMPHTVNQARLVDDATSFPIVGFVIISNHFMKLIPLSSKASTAPCDSVHPSYHETHLIRPFVPNGVSRVRSTSVVVEHMILISFPRDLRGTTRLKSPQKD